MAMLPEGWSAHDLGHLAQKIEGGGTPPRNEPSYWDGDIPWASVKDLRGVKLSTTEEFISELGLENSSSKLIPSNTMIIASRMAVGKAVFFNQDVAINQDLKAFYPKENTDGLFLLQWYLSQSEKIESLATGSTVKGIRLDDLTLLPIDLPPLPEQQKIATILSSVDDVIEKTRAQIDKLKDLKTGMMQELLTKGIGHTEFKDSPVGRIPEEWSLLVLDDMKTDKKPILRTGPFGSSLKSKDFQSTGVPVINIQNLGVGRLERENLYFISKEKATELQGYTVNYGDLVFSRVADVGRSVVIPEYANGWIMSSNLMRISVDTGRIDPKYLMYQLVNGPAVMLQLRQMTSGGGRPVVTGPLIKQINFPVPPLKEQSSIVKKIDSVDDALAINEEKLVSFSNLKKALMQDLLTGKVRVTPNESAAL